MIVLCYGMTKSGSTLAFELCKAILQTRGHVQRRLPDGAVTPNHPINFLNDASAPALERVIKAVPGSEMIAIKLHSAISPPAVQLVESEGERGNVLVQVNLRDPREICLSLVDAGVKAREQGRPAFSEIRDLETACKVTGRQLQATKRWGAIKGALHVFYDEVAFDTPTAIRQMCAQLRITDLSVDEVAEIRQQLASAFTQKNKAVLHRYKDELTLRQNEFVLSEVRGARGFINRVLERRDLSWFTQTKDASEASVEATAE